MSLLRMYTFLCLLAIGSADEAGSAGSADEHHELTDEELTEAMEAVDVNKDGKVELDEIMKTIEAEEDGDASQEELDKMRQWFKESVPKMDKNGDGSFDRDELREVV